MGDMTDVVLASNLIKLAWVLVALAFSRLLLRYFDKVAGIDFRGWYASADAGARGFYFGLRFLGL